MMMDPAELQNRQRVDEEIACLMRTVQTLRTYRNTMVPINKLPLEILSHIFTYGTGLRSLPATVCSHWRAISLQCPSLWRDLIRPYHSHPEWTALLLERSKNAPIRLDLHRVWPLSDSNKMASLELVLGHASQVEELRIIGELESFSHYLLSFKDPTPLLEDLSLELDSGFRGDASSSMVPDSFFPSTPRLRYLSLINCVVRWDGPIFQNLIELRIIRMPWMSNQGSDGLDVRFSAAQLLAILETNPTLQTLQLENAVQAVHFGTVPDEVRVSLPHLIRLQLVDPLDAGAFMRHIHFPTPTTFDISWRFDPNDSAAVFSAALAALDGTSVQFAHHANIGPRVAQGVLLICEKEGCPTSTHSDIILQLSMSFGTASTPSWLLPTLFSWLPLSRLFSLSIWDLGVEDWGPCLVHLNSLQRLKVSAGDANDVPRYPFFQALSATENSVVVPRLNTLTLRKFRFLERSKTHLMRCLESRSRHNVRLAHLTLENCTPDGSSFDTSIFQPWVGVVHHQS